jgi:hypothetical protein
MRIVTLLALLLTTRAAHADVAVPPAPTSEPDPAWLAERAKDGAFAVDARRGILQIRDSYDGEAPGSWSRDAHLSCGDELPSVLASCGHLERCLRDQIRNVLELAEDHPMAAFRCRTISATRVCSGHYAGADDGSSSGELTLVFRRQVGGRFVVDAIYNLDNGRRVSQQHLLQRELQRRRPCPAGSTAGRAR